MKKQILILTMLVLTFSLFAFPTIGSGFDLAFVQDYIIRKGSNQFNMDARIKVAEDFEIRTPFTFTIADGNKIADLGLSLIYYPFDLPLYFGISAVQFAYYDNSFLAMNEVYLGYTFNFKKIGLFIEPEMTIRDPSATYTDEYSMLRGTFPSYSSFRIRVKAGYKFFIEED